MTPRAAAARNSAVRVQQSGPPARQPSPTRRLIIRRSTRTLLAAAAAGRGDADGFIAVHIANMTGGQTYAQLSGKALAQPNNTQLQAQAATVFKGETLRSMLLNAYGWWKVSQITYIIALAAFGLGTVAGLGSVYLFAFGRRPKAGQVVPEDTQARGGCRGR
jgi:hypothetical protein